MNFKNFTYDVIREYQDGGFYLVLEGKQYSKPENNDIRIQLSFKEYEQANELNKEDLEFFAEALLNEGRGEMIKFVDGEEIERVKL